MHSVAKQSANPGNPDVVGIWLANLLAGKTLIEKFLTAVHLITVSRFD
jgi:hypothetical protein